MKQDFSVLVDGFGPFTFREFARLNSDRPDLCRAVLHLKPGRKLQTGGGAWARGTVHRLRGYLGLAIPMRLAFSKVA